MDKATIQLILEAGNIGEMTLAMWLQRIAASTAIPHIAKVLAEAGVASARWEQREAKPEEGRVRKSYLIVSLAPSTTHRLSLCDRMWKIVLELRNPYHYSVKGLEIWIEFGWPSDSN